MLGEGKSFSVAHACEGEGMGLEEPLDEEVERRYLSTSPFLLSIAEPQFPTRYCCVVETLWCSSSRGRS